MPAMYRHSTGPKTLDRLPDGGEPEPYRRITIRPAGASFGALVEGLDLRRPMDDDTFAEVDRALFEWKLLLFRDQHLTLDQHADFAARFGELVDDQLELVKSDRPVDNMVVFTRDANTVGLENEWHSDGTFRPVPPMATVLRGIDVPALGDTLFADMAAAYDNLPYELKDRIEGLSAVNDWSIGAYSDKYRDTVEKYRAAVPPVEHPVVIRHPRTGRRTLFVNRLFTRSITGLDPDESDQLLDRLCRQAEVPEFQYRFHWLPGSIAFWDNLAVQHYGSSDYFPQRRVMARAAIAGTAVPTAPERSCPSASTSS
jgi:taurine dioxygenase